MAKSPDPTKDPEFQGVIQHFLKTKPQPFTPKTKAKKATSRPKATSKKRRKLA